MPGRVSMSNALTTRHQRFACARLPGPHLAQSSCAFSATLTTPALDRRSLRWFETSPCRAISGGSPPSLAQHRLEGPIFYIVTSLSFVAHACSGGQFGRRHSRYADVVERPPEGDLPRKPRHAGRGICPRRHPADSHALSVRAHVKPGDHPTALPRSGSSSGLSTSLIATPQRSRSLEARASTRVSHRGDHGAYELQQLGLCRDNVEVAEREP